MKAGVEIALRYEKLLNVPRSGSSQVPNEAPPGRPLRVASQLLRRDAIGRKREHTSAVKNHSALRIFTFRLCLCVARREQNQIKAQLLT